VPCATISGQSSTASAPLIAASVGLRLYAAWSCKDTEPMSYRTVVSLQTNRFLGSSRREKRIKHTFKPQPSRSATFPVWWDSLLSDLRAFDLAWSLMKRRSGRFSFDETTLLRLIAASLPLAQNVLAWTQTSSFLDLHNVER
jgi:hypothetical protein